VAKAHCTAPPGGNHTATFASFLSSFAASARAEEEEGSATLLLYKKLTPAEGPYGIGKPINITLQVWNKGPGNAYSVVVKDENWKQDKFKTLYSNNTFTLDFLNTGEQYTHTFTVTPVKKILAHRVKPAVMEFVDGVEGEATIKHYSNGWPEIQAVDPGDSLADYVLMFGRLLTFNMIKTKKGWMYAGGALAAILIVQLFFIVKAMMARRRHMKALTELSKEA